MGKLYITEYSALGLGNSAQVVLEPPVRDQTPITFDSTSQPSTNAFDNATTLVRLHADSACHFSFSASTATGVTTTSMRRLAADQTEYFGVRRSSLRVHAIAST